MGFKEKARSLSSKVAAIKKLSALSEYLKKYFSKTSGGKTVVVLQRTGLVLGGGLLLLALGLAWFGPAEDRTYYSQTTQAQNHKNGETKPLESSVSGSVAVLFSNGEKKKESEQRNEIERKRKRISVKYYAPQIVGTSGKIPKAIRSGAKLVGFLLSAIDTRSPTPVRVRIAQGGEVNGIEIERGSVLTGQYSYGGSGDRIFVSFSRLDTLEGEPKQIRAQALDSGSYTAGISGEIQSDASLKTAASLGLTMFSGMADVLTEKESLGFSQNGVQPKSTMKNALLQGLSRSAQEQTGRIQAEINSARDYVVIPVGKEIIIELIEDFK